MNPGVGHQVGLELCQIDVQGTVKSERSSDGGDNLSDQSVQVGVGWPLNVQVSAANVVDGLVVDHESTVRVLEGGVSGQNRVVGFNDSSGDLNNSAISIFDVLTVTPTDLSVSNLQLHLVTCPTDSYT